MTKFLIFLALFNFTAIAESMTDINKVNIIECSFNDDHSLSLKRNGSLQGSTSYSPVKSDGSIETDVTFHTGKFFREIESLSNQSFLISYSKQKDLGDYNEALVVLTIDFQVIKEDRFKAVINWPSNEENENLVGYCALLI